jgi:hypothetical protein
MDLIDRDSLLHNLKESVKSAREWKEEAQDEEIKIRAEQARATFIECTLRVKNAPAVNRWISVEDALPEKKQKVLVFYKAIGEKNNIHNDVIATNWRKENGDFIPFEGYRITHWMPLPEPPEKE